MGGGQHTVSSLASVREHNILDSQVSIGSLLKIVECLGLQRKEFVS
tara:strand:- start:5434 stop:5571 length:138 start_codon:yes stop_codon:yes gene_type:complete